MVKYTRFICCIILFTSCVKVNSSISDLTDATGLVIAIDFNNTLTETFSGIDGINYKAAYCTDRKNNAQHAIHFDRNDSAQVDFGDLDSASFLNNIFSISCWAMLEDTLKPCAILSKRGVSGGFEYSLDNHFRNKQYFNLDNWIASGTNSVYGIDPLNAIAPISLGKWQHIVYVANGVNLNVYVNSVLQSGVDINNKEVFTNTNKHLVIGNGGGYGKNYYFQGAIDDIKIYNRVLTTNEIEKLYKE